MKPAAVAGSANRYEVVSRLADDLAHEIKNPLNAIVVNLEVLRRKVQTGATDTALERAAVIDYEIKRVHELVDQLLQLMRPQRPEVSALSIDDALSDLRPLLELQARAGRVELEMWTAGDLYARIPRDVLKFAVLNLIIVLYDAQPPVTSIRLTGERVNEDVSITVKGSAAVFASDNEFVQHAGSLMTDAGGGLEIGELSATGAGSTAVLRIAACSSFA